MKISPKSTALLIIDAINAFDFPEGKSLLRQAYPVAKNILKIKHKLKKKGVKIIYVNDHFGKWHSDWREVYKRCVGPKITGGKISELLKPEAGDYVILKPRHSGFYSSNLDVLLNELKIKHLVMTGFAGNICVLFTANDAHMRGYQIHVPRNGIASNTKKDNDYAIRQLSDVFGIDTSAL